MLDPTREVDWVECILKTAQRGGERDLMIDRGLERVRFVFMEKHRGRASGRLSSSGLIWIGSL